MCSNKTLKLSELISAVLFPFPQKIENSEGISLILSKLSIKNEFSDPRIKLLVNKIFKDNEVCDTAFLNIIADSAIQGNERYSLEIQKTHIKIRASAPAGAFYALKSLELLLRHSPSSLPCGIINDWPDLKFRGVHIMTGWKNVPHFHLLRTMLLEMADMKYNKFVIEYDEQFPWKYGAKDAYTLEELNDFIKLANENFIEVIPLIDSLGHTQPYIDKPVFKDLREDPSNISEMCPQNPKSLEFIKGIWREVLSLHKDSEYAHITGDEVFNVPPCPQCKPFDDNGRRGELFTAYYKKLVAWIKENGKKPLMWGDMFIKHTEILDGFPRDVIICDWDYSSGNEGELFDPPLRYIGKLDNEREKVLGPYWKHRDDGTCQSYPYLKFFADQGFKTIAASGAGTCKESLSEIPVFNNMNFALRAKEQGSTCLRLLNTIWTTNPLPAYWHGIVAGADYSWHCRKEELDVFIKRFTRGVLKRPEWAEPFKAILDDYAERTCNSPKFPSIKVDKSTAMAEETAIFIEFSAKHNSIIQSSRRMKENLFRKETAGIKKKIDISRSSNHKMSETLPARARRLTVKKGNYNFANIPFNFETNDIISLSALKSEKVSIDINEKVTGLVFWNTSYNTCPDKDIAILKIVYENDLDAHFSFIGGINTLDWTNVAAVPSDEKSCIGAWRGFKDDSVPIISWLTYWKNPFSENKIKYIELSSGDTGKNTYFVVLGIEAIKGQGELLSAEDFKFNSEEELRNLEADTLKLFSRWVKESYLEESTKFFFKETRK